MRTQAMLETNAPRLFSTALGVGFLALIAAGCSSDDLSGEGESCSTTADCQNGLRCRSGVCRSLNSNGDTGPDTTNGDNVTAEDYLISFVETKQGGENPGRIMKVHNTATGETKVVLPDGISNCNQRACNVSGNYEYFFATERVADQTNLLKWELGNDLTATGSSQTFAQNVNSIHMLDAHVQYQRGGPEETQTAFVHPVSGGQPITVGEFNSDGSFMTAPEHDRAVIFEPQGTQELLVKFGTLEERTAQLSLGGSNWQETGGSYFGGDVTASFSEDGSRLTFLTSAPNNYETCQRSDPQDRYSGDCETVAARCGSQQLCSRWEETAHIVDMEHIDEIGQQCSFDDDCSGVHECYYPSDRQADRAKCIPKRVVLGVPPSIEQNQMNGCELVRQDSTIDFTDVRGPITYDEQNRPYLAAQTARGCLQQYSDSEPAGQFVRLNPQEGDYTYVAGLPTDEPFQPGNCYDDASGDYDYDNCRPFIATGHLSPKANEVAFSGTIPGVTTSRQSADRLHIWHSLLDQSDRWFVGNPDSIFQTADTLDVHPIPQ